jgi:hypothetical protein
MSPSADVLKAHQTTAERAKVLVPLGLTERQACFLATVMVHSGVFVGRQYAAFAGITHGQKVHDFIEKLLVRRFVTPIALGSTGRTRIFHVHHKPLYAAIGEPDDRNRRRVHDRPGDRAPDGSGRRSRRAVRHLARLRAREAALLQTAPGRPSPGRRVSAVGLRQETELDHALLPGQAPRRLRARPSPARLHLSRAKYFANGFPSVRPAASRVAQRLGASGLSEYSSRNPSLRTWMHTGTPPTNSSRSR